MKVLIVEDNNLIRRSYISFINLNKHELKIDDIQITCVAKLEDFSAHENTTFDLAIVDWWIEGGNSETILKKLKNNKCFASIVTGYYGEASIMSLAKDLNFDIYAKPFSSSQIKHLLEMTLKRRHE
jgi:DNA-binding NtrC family response regulator